MDRAQRRLEVERVWLLAEAERSGGVEATEGLGVATWWARVSGTSVASARRRVRYSRWLVERFPALLAALGDGRMSWDHIAVVLAAVNDRTIEGFAAVQEHLPDLAAGATFGRFRRDVAHLAERIDTDGGHRPDAEDSRVSIGGGIDGVTHLTGALHGSRGEVIRAALEARTDQLALDQHRRTTSDPTIRRLTRSQLRARALEELVVANCHVEINVVVPAEAHLPARTVDGAPLSGDGITHLADTAERWRTVVVDPHGLPLSIGRATRAPTPAQRLAVWLRDGGCVFPGCDAPTHHCDLHHVTPWHHGGPTDLDNLVATCRTHHRLLHTHTWTIHLDEHQHPHLTTPDGQHIWGQQHGTRIHPGRPPPPPP